MLELYRVHKDHTTKVQRTALFLAPVHIVSITDLTGMWDPDLEARIATVQITTTGDDRWVVEGVADELASIVTAATSGVGA